MSGNDSPLVQQKAVITLLKPPALDYIRKLRRELDHDPDHLNSHRHTIGPKVQEFLASAGIYWDQKVLEGEFLQIVSQAIIQLKSVEK